MSGSPTGLLATIRRAAAIVLELAEVRLDLLAAELEDEKQRVLDALLRAALAIVLLSLGLVLAVGFVIAIAPEHWRAALLGALALACLGGGAALVAQARHRLATPGGAACATREELARDRRALVAGE